MDVDTHCSDVWVLLPLLGYHLIFKTLSSFGFFSQLVFVWLLTNLAAFLQVLSKSCLAWFSLFEVHHLNLDRAPSWILPVLGDSLESSVRQSVAVVTCPCMKIAISSPTWHCGHLLSKMLCTHLSEGAPFCWYLLEHPRKEGTLSMFNPIVRSSFVCDSWICWKYTSSRDIPSTAQAVSWRVEPGFSLVEFGAISQHCEQRAFVSKGCGAQAWSLLLFFTACTWKGAVNGHNGGGCVGQGVLHVKSSCCLSTSSLWCVCLFILICSVVIFKCSRLLHKCEP